jgi:hypothetical protein
MSEAHKDTLRLDFDRKLGLEFYASVSRQRCWFVGVSPTRETRRLQRDLGEASPVKMRPRSFLVLEQPLGYQIQIVFPDRPCVPARIDVPDV